MKCNCGTFFTKINDESQKILWCKTCGSIRIRHFDEDKYRPIMSPQNLPKANAYSLLADVRTILGKMSNDERLDFFSEIQSGYCRYCGCDDPKCQCWNDD